MAFDFPNSPATGAKYQGYTWDGQKWALTSVASPVAPTKNYIINGAMMVSQENGSTAGTTALYYPVDQFFGDFSMGGALSFAQVASVTPAGSPNRLRVTVTTADAAVAAGDLVYLAQRIEGLRVADLLFGTASAKTITLQFGVRAPAGTYCISVINSASNRAYIAEYVISAGEANTDVVKSVAIPGDTTGTWLKDNGIGLTVRWGLMVGTTFQQAAGAWGASNATGSANQFNLMGTNGNVFELFDVGLYTGVAPAFQVPDYASELLACQRYYEKLTVGIAGTNSTGSFTGGQAWLFKATKRAVPTMTGAAGSAGVVATGVEQSTANTTSGTQAGFTAGATANARL